jgi:P27 family predicted phage terminase small subunit
LPKPVQLKVLEGNPGKRALDLSGGVNPRIEIPSPPRHLSPEARKEWKRITPLLEELGLISGLDRTALALYCQAAGRLAELELAFEGKVSRFVEADKQAKGGKGDYAEAVYQASRSTTPSGYEQQSVIVQLLGKHREQVNRYLMHFGLSPAARGRVQASNFVSTQVPIPGLEEPAQSNVSRFAQFATRV